MIMSERIVDGRGRLEWMLARQLDYGTWLASAMIALGMISAFVDRPAVPPGQTVTLGTTIVTTGIALVIMLPVVRVALMATLFLHARDFLFGTIACVVLTTIGIGFGLGLYLPMSKGGAPAIEASHSKRDASPRREGRQVR